MNSSSISTVSIILHEKGFVIAENDNQEAEQVYYNVAHRAYYKKKVKAQKRKHGNGAMDDTLSMITIYSWGNKHRRGPPKESQHNIDVRDVVGDHGYRPGRQVLRRFDGRSKRIQMDVANGNNFQRYLNILQEKVLREGVRTISVNCRLGRHRSVAFSELFAKDLQEKYGFKVKVIHMELSVARVDNPTDVAKH